MEASTLQKKKNTISKGKLKKSIKNVLCRPDQLFWPEIKENEAKRLEIAIKKYSIKIPEFKKPHWKDLKDIPKEKRPKPPKLEKIEGLFFGISECSTAIQQGHCSAVIIEATVNPQMIVQPVIEMCTSKNITLLCMNHLRKATLANFGVKTTCLGLKKECLTDLQNEILDISKAYPRPKPSLPLKQEKVEVMDINEEVIKPVTDKMDVSESPYLYRTNKKSRVFVPTGQKTLHKATKKFVGQDFIDFSDKLEEKDSKSYMKMILKRISNNSDRVKKK
ncbi:uncharacterized protein LOC142979647 [Anticarsia gemmatalis]|uniref:uncharacterized protein LOC142979647 n=1 Tax=Anticarsia gemmatalis TaxID=129554 RepID=UPI003F7643B4